MDRMALERGSDMDQVTVELGDIYASIQDDLTIVKRIFDDEIDSDLPFVNELCDRIRAYRGKMLRPALLLLVGRACGTVTEAHHVLAAVVEMVHMATLVHDDVLDEANLRRRHATINATDGNVAAVLLGDYLISHAFHLCSSRRSQSASRLIGHTTNVVCEGELMQNHWAGRCDMSEETYFDIIARKTAALTAAACELGARWADVDDGVVRAMRAYGERAGIAFQIMDDVLDLVGTQDQMGKTLGRDLDLGKPTLPVIHCLAEGDATAASTLSRMMAGGEHPSASVQSLLAATGSIDYAVRTARAYVAQALSALEAVGPSEARASLTALAEFILRRNV